jgi:hypothetical protein
MSTADIGIIAMVIKQMIKEQDVRMCPGSI